jgi:hypothetical protein
MADFRKLFLALIAGALLFTAVASAQPYSCIANAVPTLVRVEGLADYVGDVLLVCNGSVPAGGLHDVNVRMTLSTNITSNPLGSGSTSLASTLREATLVLDDGASGFKGYSSISPLTPYTDATQNVFQGLRISNTEIEWQGLTLAAVGSNGVFKTIRLTNIRANAQGLGNDVPVVATINITAPTSVPITNNSLVVANTRTGLTFSVEDLSLKTCLDPDSQESDTFRLRFREGFGTAFRPYANDLDGIPAGEPTAVPHNIPGGGYADEQGFQPTPLAGGGSLVNASLIGAADQGTRLVSRIKGVPVGATLNVTDTIITTTGGLVLTYCQDESASSSGACSNSDSTVAVDDDGNATIVYQVTGYASPYLSVSFSDTVDINVEVDFEDTPGPVGEITANGNFAPISTAATASYTAFEPRFVDSAEDDTAVVILKCRTVLLFPYVTNQAGFDTGIAIANTTADPLGTTAQSGTCTLNYYGNTNGSTGPAAQTSPAVGAGSHLALMLSGGGGVFAKDGGFTACASGACVAPLFQGYIIAACEFQFAHGFAYVSDVQNDPSGRTLGAMGYLALIIPDRGIGDDSRLPADNSLGNANNQGEQLGN